VVPVEICSEPLVATVEAVPTVVRVAVPLVLEAVLVPVARSIALSVSVIDAPWR